MTRTALGVASEITEYSTEEVSWNDAGLIFWLKKSIPAGFRDCIVLIKITVSHFKLISFQQQFLYKISIKNENQNLIQIDEK